MNQRRRIAIADEASPVRGLLRRSLEEMGHQIVVDAASGDELIDGCRAADPQLVVADIGLKAADGEDAACRVTKGRRLPLVMVAESFDPTAFNRFAECETLGYIFKPIRVGELQPAIEIALLRHDEMETLRLEAEANRQALADRKVIERAKGLLMKRGRVDESEAFQRLRLSARQHGKKMVDVARSILLAEGLLHGDGAGS